MARTLTLIAILLLALLAPAAAHAAVFSGRIALTLDGALHRPPPEARATAPAATAPATSAPATSAPATTAASTSAPASQPAIVPFPDLSFDAVCHRGQWRTQFWATAPDYNRFEHRGKIVRAESDGKTARLDVQINVEGTRTSPGGSAEYALHLTIDGPAVAGTFTGTFLGKEMKGSVAGELRPLKESRTTARAGTGLVLTRDGRSIPGIVTLTPAGLQIAGKDDRSETLDLARVLQATFRQPAMGEAASALPREWSAHDIGEFGLPGVATASADAFALRATGNGLASGALVGPARAPGDSLFYVRHTLVSDAAIVARVTALQPVKNASVGVMVRDGNFAGDRRVTRMATVYVRSDGTLAFSSRADGGAPLRTVAGPKVALPVWLKIDVRYNVFTGHYSTDGENWTPVGSAALEIPRHPARGCTYGLALVGGSDDQLTSATLDRVRIDGGYVKWRAVEPDPDAPATWQDFPAAAPLRGLVARGGSVIADPVFDTLDRAAVSLTKGNETLSLPLDDIAWLSFAPLTREMLSRMPAGKPGLVLVNGDFIEGRPRTLARQRVRVDSVIFGLRPFEIGTEAAAVMLRPVTHAPTAWEVRLADGTTYLADTFKIEGDTLLVRDAAFGDRRAPLRDLYLLRANQAGITPLSQIKPTRVEGPPGAAVLAGFASDHALATMLPLGSQTCDHGVFAPGPTALTYTLDGAASRFIARVGVPSAAPSAARVRFIVIGDGRELHRSAPLAAEDPPPTVSLDLRGIKSLTLKTQREGAADVAITALWGDAFIVR